MDTRKRKNQERQNMVLLINNPKFAYFMGFFAADGSYYKDGRCGRFEFSDGSSVKNEIKYSKKFLGDIKMIIEELLDIDTPNLRRRKNRYVLQFRNKNLEIIFRECFGIKTGPKGLSFKIPSIYVDNELERFFWLGVMDGDGMVARYSRKIALAMINKKLVFAFKRFLKKNGIIVRLSVTKRSNYSNMYYSDNDVFTLTINAPFFKRYSELLGFYHPRKKLWLEKHLQNKNVYLDNIVEIPEQYTINKIINYKKLFDSGRVYIVNGKALLRKYELKHKGRKNVQFYKIFNLLENKGFSDKKIFKILSNCKWKMSKGSMNSVKLPSRFDRDIIKIAEFVRLREGSVGLSRLFIQSSGEKPEKIIKLLENRFDIKAKYTSRKEPIFCSGVLNLFFTKIIKRNTIEYKIPEWHEELKC
ncbi:MAG: LAGLIDADG family homing endonuclease [Nanoarchaeota archaeon]